MVTFIAILRFTAESYLIDFGNPLAPRTGSARNRSERPRGAQRKVVFAAAE